MVTATALVRLRFNSGIPGRIASTTERPVPAVKPEQNKLDTEKSSGRPGFTPPEGNKDPPDSPLSLQECNEHLTKSPRGENTARKEDCSEPRRSVLKRSTPHCLTGSPSLSWEHRLLGKQRLRGTNMSHHLLRKSRTCIGRTRTPHAPYLHTSSPEGQEPCPTTDKV